MAIDQLVKTNRDGFPQIDPGLLFS